MEKKKKKIVTVGGGGGHAAVVSALKDLPIELTALTNTVDDGGSSGELMREYGVRSPGEPVRALHALDGERAKDLLYRFGTGSLAGMTVGNVLLAGYELSLGSHQAALDTVRKMFGIRHRVAPLTAGSPVLHARTVAGKNVVGQAEIVRYIRTPGSASFETVWIEPKDAGLSEVAKDALSSADYIIVSMGDLYSSIASTLCVKEYQEVLKKTSATVIWLPNVAVTPGHSHYTTTSGALTFLQSIAASFDPDIVIAASDAIPAPVREELTARGYGISAFDLSNEGRRIIRADLLSDESIVARSKTDVIDRSPIRYRTDVLQNIFSQLFYDTTSNRS